MRVTFPHQEGRSARRCPHAHRHHRLVRPHRLRPGPLPALRPARCRTPRQARALRAGRGTLGPAGRHRRHRAARGRGGRRPPHAAPGSATTAGRTTTSGPSATAVCGARRPSRGPSPPWTPRRGCSSAVPASRRTATRATARSTRAHRWAPASCPPSAATGRPQPTRPARRASAPRSPAPDWWSPAAAGHGAYFFPLFKAGLGGQARRRTPVLELHLPARPHRGTAPHHRHRVRLRAGQPVRARAADQRRGDPGDGTGAAAGPRCSPSPGPYCAPLSVSSPPRSSAVPARCRGYCWTPDSPTPTPGSTRRSAPHWPKKGTECHPQPFSGISWRVSGHDGSSTS